MVGKQSRTSSATQSAYSPPVLIGRKPALSAGLEGLLPEIIGVPVGFHSQSIQWDALVVL